MVNKSKTHKNRGGRGGVGFENGLITALSKMFRLSQLINQTTTLDQFIKSIVMSLY